MALPSHQQSYFSPHSGNKYDRKTDRQRLVLRIPSVALAISAVAALCLLWTAQAGAGPPATRLAFATGEIVPLPASIPHEEGDMVDRRIVPDLRWIAARFPIYVTDGYSGPLPDGEHAGCRGCHVRNSDHYNGLAVDVVAIDGTGRCDRAWRGITRLAKWAEPRQNRPVPPFRWVGYNGDAGHGCGHHLHLSWQHSEVPMFQLAEWVEVFPVRLQGVSDQPRPKRIKPKGAAKPAPSGPPGGVATIHAGGISARGD